MSTEDLRDSISPPEFIRLHCFPLKDYELGKIYEYHVKIIDQIHVIHRYARLSQDEIKIQDDYQKIQRRAVEFASRFARNNLYPLQRACEKLKEYFDAGKAYLRKNSEWLRKHLTTTYQTAFQALQVYLSYITSPKNLQVNEKLVDLLTTIREMNAICRTVLIPIIESVGHEKEDILELSCMRMINFLKRPPPVPPKFPMMKKKAKKPSNNPLYMYEGKLSRWKQKSEMLAKLAKKKSQKDLDEVSTDHETPVIEKKVVKKLSGKVLKDQDVQTVVETISFEDLQKEGKSENVKLCVIKSHLESDSAEIEETKKDLEKREIPAEAVERLLAVREERKSALAQNKNYLNIGGIPPWIYIGRIADEIYCEYLTSVTSELEIDESLLDELFLNELEDEVSNYIIKP